MELKLQILYIVISVVVLAILMAITKAITRRVTLVKNLEPNRKKVVQNVFYFLYYIVFFTVVVIILGIDWEELSVFLSSALAIVGIALFAQWSILSNVTASIIIFFYHPLKIGHKIKVLDKEIDTVGQVIDITGFFVMIEDAKGERISIPNSIILQKGVLYLSDD